MGFNSEFKELTDDVLKPSKNEKKINKSLINHRSLKVHLLPIPYKINHL